MVQCNIIHMVQMQQKIFPAQGVPGGLRAMPISWIISFTQSPIMGISSIWESR